MSRLETIRKRFDENSEMYGGRPSKEIMNAYATMELAEALKTQNRTNQPKAHRSTAILGGVSAGKLEEMDLPQRSPLLCNETGVLLFEQSINQILAHRGVGKTMLGLSMAGALANGTPLLGFQSTKPCRVLYADGELPLSQLKERAALLAAGPHTAENLFLLNPELSHPTESIRLLDDYTWGQFMTLVHQHRAEVVMLDSYSTLFWMDANKEEAQLATQMRLNELRSRGLCVVALQHTGKDKKTQRGHSRNEDGLDVQMLLERPDSATAGRVAFDISFPKLRHGACFEPSGTWTLGPDNKWVMVESSEGVAIRAYLKEGKGINWIARELHIDNRRIMEVRQKMQLAGLLALEVKVGRGTTGKSLLKQ